MSGPQEFHWIAPEALGRLEALAERERSGE